MQKLKEILHSLGDIFPRYLTLLAISPILIGMIINPSLVDSRDLVINLVWLALFTILAIWTHKRIFIYIVAIAFFIINSIEVANWGILKAPINLVSLLALANTNPGEASEFMESQGWMGLFPVLILVLLLILSLRQKNTVSTGKTARIVQIVVFAGVCIFIGENTINNRLIRKGSPHLIKTGVAFSNTIDGYRAAMNNAVPREVEIMSRDSKARTIVLILGESLNRNHMSLYGSNRLTNPLLSKRKDVRVFNDVISPYSNTVSSVLNSLSETNVESSDTGRPKIDIIDIMHAAGYKTYWLSNQPPIGVWENIISYLANKCDVSKYVNTTSSSSFEATYTRSYDEKLFEPFEESLKDTAKRKFIVLHLMGNHTSYARRYPSAYKKWKADGEVEETRAHYANAVLYNDYIVNSLFDQLAGEPMDKPKPQIAIYLSDHGENVYDEGNVCGHHYSDHIPYSNVEVPFLLWSANISITDSLNRNTPYMTDDLFHTLQDIARVQTMYCDSSRAFLNNAYNNQRERKLENGEVYTR